MALGGLLASEWDMLSLQSKPSIIVWDLQPGNEDRGWLESASTVVEIGNEHG